MNKFTDIVDPIGTHTRLKPVGFWQMSMHLAVAQYSLSGSKPNWLKRLLVYWATGWKWVDYNSTGYN